MSRGATVVYSMPLKVVGGLGRGGYAVVVKVEHTDDHTVYAMKVISKERAQSKREQDRLKIELHVMTEIEPSPFLLHCHMAFETSSRIFFVLDFVGGEDLFSHLVNCVKKGRSGFKEAEARVLLAEITVALEHLHSRGFIHRDIKVCPPTVLNYFFHSFYEFKI